MSTKKEKKYILEALDAGDYRVEYEPVNSIFERKRANGSVYYVMEDLDGPRSSTDLGSITFIIENDDYYHEFIYDLNCGDWSGDELCDDDDIVDTLEDLDEFIDSEDYNGDLQREIYIKANNLPEDTEIYWCEDDDCPDNCGFNEEYKYIPLKYVLAKRDNSSSESEETECALDDDELKKLVEIMREKGGIEESEKEPEEECEADHGEVLYEDLNGDEDEEDDDVLNYEIDYDQNDNYIRFPSIKFKKENPQLYETVIEQIKEDAYLDDEEEIASIEFVLYVPKEYLEDL